MILVGIIHGLLGRVLDHRLDQQNVGCHPDLPSRISLGQHATRPSAWRRDGSPPSPYACTNVANWSDAHELLPCVPQQLGPPVRVGPPSS